jgi:hypothetical protein
MSTDVMLSLGADALTNMFDISFPEGLPTGGNENNLALRCDGDLQIPPQVVGTYDVWRKGIKITKSNTTTETDKRFTTESRIDQNWEIMDDVVTYCTAVYDPITGTAMPSETMKTTVLCTPVDPQNTIMKVFRFKNAQPIEWQLTPFSNQGTDAMKLTITWIYVDFILENA